MVSSMKIKSIIPIYFMLLVLISIIHSYIPHERYVSAEEPIVIPDEAIRLRILANSDHEEDQKLKRKIRDAVNEQITQWVEDLTSIEEARYVIRQNIPTLEQIAKDVMEEEQMNQNLQITFDKVQFPTKLYGSFLYPAGKYEAILITLGEGKGANWWCVLFPPLCFLDISNGSAVGPEAEEKEMDGKLDKELADLEDEKEDNSEIEEESPLYTGEEEEVEVKFFLVELIEKIFN